ADASGLPCKRGLAVRLGNKRELEKAPKRVAIPASPQGLPGRKRKRPEEEEETAEEPPRKKRAEEGRKVCVKPPNGKPTLPAKRARKRNAAEMHPSAAEDMDEPPAKKPALAVEPALPEYSLVTIPEVEKPPSSLELHLGSQADSAAQSEVSNPTSHSSQAADKTQQLSCTDAGEALLSEDDDLEKFMIEISGELEGEIDLEAGRDVDELLLELSEIIDSVTP
ncbi:zinc finger CCCH domain-containing protein 11A-like, partial [Numida meleagris]|uniref:zinc finger CCCH domain-containing protein 11A-like n=1 Tax=Numida meleagris TaxID=8996 RepID=UPI000B3DB6C7